MAKDLNKLLFLDAKEDVLENLKTIQTSLIRCIDEGMIDEEDIYYNELLDLIEEAYVVDNWDEIMEVVAKAKTLEIDVANWLARHGISQMSLLWPKNPSK